MEGSTASFTLKRYAAHVGRISDDHEWEDRVYQALIARSALEEHLAELTTEQRAELARLDAELVRQWERVAQLLPARGKHERSHWWWYLHEGVPESLIG